MSHWHSRSRWHEQRLAGIPGRGLWVSAHVYACWRIGRLGSVPCAHMCIDHTRSLTVHLSGCWPICASHYLTSERFSQSCLSERPPARLAVSPSSIPLRLSVCLSVYLSSHPSHTYIFYIYIYIYIYPSIYLISTRLTLSICLFIHT